MNVRPGARLLLVLALFALVSPTAFWWPPLLYLLALAVALLLGAAEADRRQANRTIGAISAKRSMPLVAGRDRPVLVTLTIANHANRSLVGMLRDEVPASAKPRLLFMPLEILPSHSVELTHEYRLSQRGRKKFGPVWVRAAGPLRLAEVHKSIPCFGEVKVLPETFASREQLQKDIGAELRLLDRNLRARQHGEGTQFESLHPFRPGDDPRRIDWRATARLRTHVVRRFQVERHRDVMVLIDRGRLMGADVGPGTKLDCAVDGALNLARVALHSGDRCGIGVFDSKVRGFLPPISGTSALRSLVECVYDVDTEWQESDFAPILAELRARQGKRTFLIILSDLSDAETSRRLCASLVQLQRQHLVLFVALKTPLLRQVIYGDVASPRDAARKAVAFRLLRDRNRAIHALKHGGVHVLDVEPQQISLPLVNQFIELRQRNLL